jgi:hypothetical protein
MAVTAYGFKGAGGAAGIVDDVQWARIGSYMAKALYVPHYITGGVASSGGATRIVNIATGTVAACNVIGDIPTGQSIALAANASGLSRIDYVVANFDWPGRAITLTSVAGQAAASPIPPALTQNPGVTWQVPIARCTVPNGATTITAGNIEDCRPLDRKPVKYTGVIASLTNRAQGSTSTVSTVTVPDPGWPYRLVCKGEANIQCTAGFGFAAAASSARCYVNINSVQADPVGRTGFGLSAVAVFPGYTSAVHSAEACTVTFTVDSAGSTGNYDVLSAHTYFEVVVVPG